MNVNLADRMDDFEKLMSVCATGIETQLKECSIEPYDVAGVINTLSWIHEGITASYEEELRNRG